MSVIFMIKPYKKSTAGWTIGLQFSDSLSDGVIADETFNTMKLTKISKNRDYFEFQATSDFSDFNAYEKKRVPFAINFKHTNDGDKELIMTSDMHYFSETQENTHCTVDRFECFPRQ